MLENRNNQHQVILEITCSTTMYRLNDIVWLLREILENCRISHSDLKDCIVPPYYYDEYGNKVVEDFIETYFDIK